jgi:long-chain-alcohol oxidase
MENEIQAIQSILDTLFPVCELHDERAETEIELALKDIYAFSVSSCEGLPSQILTAMDQRLNRDQASQLHIILRLLANRWGTLLLCGRHCLSSTLVPTAFIHLPPAQRASVLRSWYASSLPQFRKVFKGIKSLLLSATMTWLDPHTHGSPLLTAMAYPVSDPYRPAHPRPAALDAERAVTASLIDLKGKPEADISVKEAAAMLRSKGLMVVFPPSPHTGGSTTEETSSAAEGHVASTVWASNPSFTVVCDAIVVGSGAGGGVAASRLAAAGLKVVVVEKGGFVAAADMTGREGEAFGSMMECGGLLTTEDGCTSVLAGSTLGGGTR